jgi:hypothetical protein
VIDFATMTKAAAFRDGSRAGFIDKAAIRARAAIDKAAERARQSEARAKAEDMVKHAALDVHPYLAAKGFPEERGLVLDGELLIPMREFRHLRADQQRAAHLGRRHEALPARRQGEGLGVLHRAATGE